MAKTRADVLALAKRLGPWPSSVLACATPPTRDPLPVVTQADYARRSAEIDAAGQYIGPLKFAE